jgi:hypothetical protein
MYSLNTVMNINVLCFLHKSKFHEDFYEEGYHIPVTDAANLWRGVWEFFVADVILFRFNIQLFHFDLFKNVLRWQRL